MPRSDKTGPMGMGPRTGRAMGSCVDAYGPGLGICRGYGRAMCGWFWKNHKELPKNERKEILQGEIDDLNQELKMIEEEMKNLEKE